MSEIKNGRLGLYGTEHPKFNHMMTLGFKGLSKTTACCRLALKVFKLLGLARVIRVELLL